MQGKFYVYKTKWKNYSSSFFPSLFIFYLSEAIET